MKTGVVWVVVKMDERHLIDVQEIWEADRPQSLIGQEHRCEHSKMYCRLVEANRHPTYLLGLD